MYREFDKLRVPGFHLYITYEKILQSENLLDVFKKNEKKNVPSYKKQRTT